MSDEEISYEVQVLRGAQWSRYLVTDTLPQAQNEAFAALEEKKYLDAARIICERRDLKTNKINVVTFQPVTREQAAAAVQTYVAAQAEATSAVQKRSTAKTESFKYYVMFYTALLLVILWGGYYALTLLQTMVFPNTPR